MSVQTKLRLKSGFRVVVLLVTMMLLLVASPAPPPTCAANSSFCLWRTRVYFYTDATKTTQCGFSNYSCFGKFTHTGCYSDYYTITECECSVQ